MRGKHGAAAAVRQEVQTRDAEIDTYRNAVVRLTSERNEARTQLKAEQKRHRAAEKELRARLDVAAAPKIDALEALVAKRTEERDEARREQARTRRTWERALLKLRDHFVEHHDVRPGYGALEAAIALLDLPGWDPKTRITAMGQEQQRLAGVPTTVLETIQRKQGSR